MRDQDGDTHSSRQFRPKGVFRAFPRAINSDPYSILDLARLAEPCAKSNLRDTSTSCESKGSSKRHDFWDRGDRGQAFSGGGICTHPADSTGPALNIVGASKLVECELRIT